jgi:hypothetical protein
MVGHDMVVSALRCLNYLHIPILELLIRCQRSAGYYAGRGDLIHCGDAI